MSWAEKSRASRTSKSTPWSLHIWLSSRMGAGTAFYLLPHWKPQWAGNGAFSSSSSSSSHEKPLLLYKSPFPEAKDQGLF